MGIASNADSHPMEPMTESMAGWTGRSDRDGPGPATNTVEQLQLMLREVTHRCANDLQLVASLLRLQSRRTASEEVRQELNEAADRVAVLAEARNLARRQEPSLASALRHVCTALNSQAEPRSILITLEFATAADGFSDEQITCLALCVNELATNAIKHAFRDRNSGRIDVAVEDRGDGTLAISVEDDGAPLSENESQTPPGMGLDLVHALLRSVDGALREPTNGSKKFEIVVAPGHLPPPAHHASDRRSHPAHG